MEDKPYIPGYLKGTPIERLNSAYPLYLPTRFEECWTRHVNQAESVPTDYPIPPEVLLYYFEVDIIDKGEDGYIGVGFAKDLEILEILPGWCPGTMGYHGDDGCKFYETGRGINYGPLYSTGDTIGCCVNFVDQHIFYTKNGVNLGIAFECALKEDLFPIIGLRTHGECVEANFGTKPFKFDIDSYAKAFFSEPRIAAQIEGPKEILMRHIDIDVFDENLYKFYDFV
ncbi:13181_t:CDS:2 [Cetraspora pellucida]|uniref:13181_t:CDS:1 n=1 Tax=Cetraspora pellucida TaxID=1433469 RepID=A0A9N8VM89_9GLOM|nr:13181_t:CDS:2 [Cetraspora pellucida]